MTQHHFRDNCWRDLKYAARVLKRAKTTSAASFLILALGIGATTAVFSVLDQLVYRPLAVPNPSELVRLSEF